MREWTELFWSQCETQARQTLFDLGMISIFKIQLGTYNIGFEMKVRMSSCTQHYVAK